MQIKKRKTGFKNTEETLKVLYGRILSLAVRIAKIEKKLGIYNAV